MALVNRGVTSVMGCDVPDADSKAPPVRPDVVLMFIAILLYHHRITGGLNQRKRGRLMKPKRSRPAPADNSMRAEYPYIISSVSVRSMVSNAVIRESRYLVDAPFLGEPEIEIVLASLCSSELKQHSYNVMEFHHERVRLSDRFFDQDVCPLQTLTSEHLITVWNFDPDALTRFAGPEDSVE